VKPGDLVRLVRKITPYNAPQEGSKHTRWHTIHPGDVGMLVAPVDHLFGLFLFGEARVEAVMEMFEVLSEAR